MKKHLFLIGLMICSMATMAQSEGTDKPESWYFKLGGSYFIQTAATEFPIVNGQAPNTDVYAANGTTLISRETNHGSFGEGFRSGLTAGYRISTRLGVEMGINYYSSADKLMVETTNRLVPGTTNVFVTGDAVGKIRAWDLSPSLVLFLGESKGFEPYTKVGVIVPIHGDLTIETNREYYAVTPTATTVVAKTYAEDVVKPNPTLGFMAAIGSSYKLGKKIALFAEIEYRNFTVHGDTKETTVFTENGVDKLHTASTFRPDPSYSAIHTNYVDKLTTKSNTRVTNPTGFDNTKATDDISSYVGISGVGLTFGLRYSL
ncbi:outer membrane beta-barrel protein [Flavobacterium pectinovorum]|uniref:outer membrane beta-barrel protein n=1 Tax=Flavobacterium pectinovorum TaxID=29533 RepID=UPI001FABA90A|nr:outer membrane beta-barrel protein [Flavobacterium pectinovorum]MCI9845247.1 outer membrane beta-barrel protein [Flavobacterium pectinovorum]